MNLIEHYIKDIHEETVKEYPTGNWILADVTINCYGSIDRVDAFMPADAWEKAKERGYYLS